MATLDLPSGTIDLWLLERQRIPQSWMAAGILTTAERERAAGFQDTARQESFIAARTVLRVLSGFYLGVDADAPVLVTEPKGKPYWRDDADRLDFNISHSGSWIALAFAAGRAVGVDLQATDPAGAWRAGRVVERGFCDDEREAITTAPEGKRQDLFCRIWTAKEAVIKCAGLTVQGTLGDFSVMPATGKRIWQSIISHNEKLFPGSLAFWPYAPDASHHGALAVDTADGPYTVNLKGAADLQRLFDK